MTTDPTAPATSPPPAADPTPNPLAAEVAEALRRRQEMEDDIGRPEWVRARAHFCAAAAYLLPRLAADWQAKCAALDALARVAGTLAGQLQSFVDFVGVDGT